MPDLGCKCVSEEPWVTVAESCELILALNKIDEKKAALEIFENISKLIDQKINFFGQDMFTKMTSFGQSKSQAGRQLQLCLQLIHFLNSIQLQIFFKTAKLFAREISSKFPDFLALQKIS